MLRVSKYLNFHYTNKGKKGILQTYLQNYGFNFNLFNFLLSHAIYYCYYHFSKILILNYASIIFYNKRNRRKAFICIFCFWCYKCQI